MALTKLKAHQITGLGDMATQDKSAVDITGGQLSGLTSVGVNQLLLDAFEGTAQAGSIYRTLTGVWLKNDDGTNARFLAEEVNNQRVATAGDCTFFSGVNMVFRTIGTAGATNYCGLAGSAGTAPASFSAASSVNTDVGVQLKSQGLGAVSLVTGDITRVAISGSSGAVAMGGTFGGEAFRVTPVANQVNYISILGGIAGGYASISANGADANINLPIAAKGTGSIFFNAGNAWRMLIYPTGTVCLGGSAGSEAFKAVSNVNQVNRVEATGTVTGTSPSVAAAGSDGNLDLILQGKGTGHVRFGSLTAVADSPITGYITIKDAGGTMRKLAVIA